MTTKKTFYYIIFILSLLLTSFRYVENGELKIIVRFYFQTDEIDSQSRKILDNLITLLDFEKISQLSIEGHADASEENAKEHSLKRAEIVRDYIVRKKEIDEKYIEIKGHGGNKPYVVRNEKGKKINVKDSPYTRIKNNRVEIGILIKDEDYQEELEVFFQEKNILYEKG